MAKIPEWLEKSNLMTEIDRKNWDTFSDEFQTERLKDYKAFANFREKTRSKTEFQQFLNLRNFQAQSANALDSLKKRQEQRALDAARKTAEQSRASAAEPTAVPIGKSLGECLNKTKVQRNAPKQAPAPKSFYYERREPKALTAQTAAPAQPAREEWEIDWADVIAATPNGKIKLPKGLAEHLSKTEIVFWNQTPLYKQVEKVSDYQSWEQERERQSENGVPDFDLETYSEYVQRIALERKIADANADKYAGDEWYFIERVRNKPHMRIDYGTKYVVIPHELERGFVGKDGQRHQPFTQGDAREFAVCCGLLTLHVLYGKEAKLETRPCELRRVLGQDELSSPSHAGSDCNDRNRRAVYRLCEKGYLKSCTWKKGDKAFTVVWNADTLKRFLGESKGKNGRKYPNYQFVEREKFAALKRKPQSLRTFFQHCVRYPFSGRRLDTLKAACGSDASYANFRKNCAESFADIALVSCRLESARDQSIAPLSKSTFREFCAERLKDLRADALKNLFERVSLKGHKGGGYWRTAENWRILKWLDEKINSLLAYLRDAFPLKERPAFA